MIWAGALATWNYCNCEKINDDKVARFHTREKSSLVSQLQNNKDEMDEGKKKCWINWNSVSPWGCVLERLGASCSMYLVIPTMGFKTLMPTISRDF